jgi:predicted GH43/DUF377 family glycosyl hydrolase
MLQVGNCGPPIEIDRGWLVLTRGVGPMRVYGIGAMLLDLDWPTRVLRKLERPLLQTSPAEQDGYVPNVVIPAVVWCTTRCCGCPTASATRGSGWLGCPSTSCWPR